MADAATQASADRRPVRLLRAAAIAGLLVAASIHLALAPAHLALSSALGLGFLATGLIQAAVAGALVIHLDRRAVLGAVIISTLALGAYAVDVTIGLPGMSHVAVHADVVGHGDVGHLSSGSGSLDAPAIGAKGAELLTLIAGVALYRRRSA